MRPRAVFTRVCSSRRPGLLAAGFHCRPRACRLAAGAAPRRYPSARIKLHQDALAQAAVGDAQPAALPFAPDRLEHGAAGEHQVGALAPDAGIVAPRLVVHAAQLQHHPLDLVVLHPQPVDIAAVVARQVEMHAGERRHRAGGAEIVEGARARPRAFSASRAWKRWNCERTSSTIASNTRSSTVDAAMPLGERHDADRQRDPGAHEPAAAARLPPVEPDDLRRAAADVEEHRAVRRPDRAARSSPPPRAAPRCGGRRSQASSPISVAHAVEEVRAVLRDAAGLRRDQPRAAPSARRSSFWRADAQRADARAPSRPRRAARSARPPRRAARCARRNRRRGSRRPPARRSAAGNCWCRDRAPHRTARAPAGRRGAPRILAFPARRPPPPPSGSTPGWSDTRSRRTDAAGRARHLPARTLAGGVRDRAGQRPRIAESVPLSISCSLFEGLRETTRALLRCRKDRPSAARSKRRADGAIRAAAAGRGAAAPPSSGAGRRRARKPTRGERRTSSRSAPRSRRRRRAAAPAAVADTRMRAEHDRAERRDHQRAAELAEEADRRGRRAQFVRRDGVLHRDRRDRQHRPHADADQRERRRRRRAATCARAKKARTRQPAAATSSADERHALVVRDARQPPPGEGRADNDADGERNQRQARLAGASAPSPPRRRPAGTPSARSACPCRSRTKRSPVRTTLLRSTLSGMSGSSAVSEPQREEHPEHDRAGEQRRGSPAKPSG